MSKPPTSMRCQATAPSSLGYPHECKLTKGHEGWHTCTQCDWNWVTPDDWDWLSIRDRLDTLSEMLETPPDSHRDLADELRSMANWIQAQDK